MKNQPHPNDGELQPGASRAGRRRDAGQVVVLFALMIFVLIGFVALAIDGGFIMSERRRAQSAADGAAMAADKAYQRGEIADIVPTGVEYATGGPNDDADGFDADEVTINPYETYTVNGITYEQCVEAIIESNVTAFFVGAFVDEAAWRVTARAVACTEPDDREYALFAIDPDGDGITAGGTADVLITNGGGSMSNAHADYCGSVDWIQTDGPLDSADGIDVCNNANVESLPPNPSAPEVEDPLADVDEPDCSSLSVYTNQNPAIPYPLPGGEPDVNARNADLVAQVYPPGNYPQGLRISGRHTVVFESGLYCIGGNGLELTAGSSQNLAATGDDVMFYMYGSNSMFDIDGQGVNLDVSNIDKDACVQEACTAGIIVFYSRGVLGGQPEDCTDLVLNGNVVNIEGILYAACSEIRLEGNGDLTVTGQFIGGSIYVRGGNQVTINYDSDLNIAPPQVYLVE